MTQSTNWELNDEPAYAYVNCPFTRTEQHRGDAGTRLKAHVLAGTSMCGHSVQDCRGLNSRLQLLQLWYS